VIGKAMKRRWCLAGLGLGMLLTCPQPAGAQSTNGVVLWDRHIAGALHELLLSDNSCTLGPFRLFRQTCIGNELNINPDRLDDYPLTTLDEFALFVHRYHDLNLNRELQPGTQIKLRANLSNVYKEEAEIQLSLRIRF
jgi:hypothetical protein